MRRTLMACAIGLVACGGAAPPPRAEEPVQAPRRSSGPAPVVQQELGSIDERAVVQTFDKLQGQLARCQTHGRARVEYLSGDAKAFLRIDANGKVRYGYLEESSLGDRETERCMLGVFSAAQWPKPIGGEAEVRSGFGFEPGDERQPASWGPERVATAIEESRDVKKALDRCRASGVRVTAYVVHDAAPAEEHPTTGPGKKRSGAHARDKPPAKEKKEHGKFHAIGVAAATKEAAEKIDCVIDALKELRLPSPGSYAAKVAFTL